jgi:integrase
MEQFTDKMIKALKPKDHIYDVREKNGFTIRVFPSGVKSWAFLYTYNGRKRRMTLGDYKTMSLAEARIKHGDAYKMLKSEEKDPAQVQQLEKAENRDSSTISGLIEEYIEKWAKPRKRSWKEDKRLLDRDVKPVWGKRKAKDITKRDVVLLLEDIVKRGAPIAANRAFACVRRMFNFAVERDIILATPCTTIKAPSKENQRDRCLTSEEINAFWHALERAPMSVATKIALKLQLVTAQRKGEILGAEWSEINLETRWWVIPDNKAKNGIHHRVALSELAIELINELKKLSGKSRWLFPSDTNRSHMRGESIGKAVRRSDEQVFEKAKIKHFTPHDLRRTAATHMTEMGISRLVVSKILNHVDSSITAIYDRHSYDAEKRNALEAWGKKLRQLIDSEQPAGNIIDLGQASRQKQVNL